MSRVHLLTAIALLAVAAAAPAQEHAHGKRSQQGTTTASQADGEAVRTGVDAHAHHARPDHADHADHADHLDHTDHAGRAARADDAPPDAPLEPVPPLTDADRAAAFPALTRHMPHPSPVNWRVLLDHFELVDGDEGRGQAWEGKAWLGTDTDRLWLRAGGERSEGRTTGADVELLYGRAIGPWWELVAGLRHDVEPGPSRTRAAFGVQGMAPYRFEVSATAYVGDSGRTAAHLEAEYDLLLSNRLILQPVVGTWLHGDDDPHRGTGSGLSSSELALRLRYELHRQFAPYVGIVRERSHGRSAELRRTAGHPASETLIVAGVRWWF